MSALPILLVDNVAWNRTTPCSDCPFLKTSPFHEGVADSIPQYVESIQRGQFAHTCHKTDNRADCDGPRNFNGQPQHCAGAILMLLKTGMATDLQLPLLQAAERGELDLKAMTAKAKVAAAVFTLPELLRFYAAELKRQISTPKARAALRRADRRRRRATA